MADDQKLVLRVPTNRRLPNDHDLNVGVDHIDVIVTVDPTIETRGEHQPAYGADLVRLREWDEQVLLHELLHVATSRSRWWHDPQRQVSDPHGHDVISRIEVALWETGWRRVDDEAERERDEVLAVLAAVREVRDHYASPTAFPPDGLVPVASVVSRLDAALATPTTPEEAPERESSATLAARYMRDQGWAADIPPEMECDRGPCWKGLNHDGDCSPGPAPSAEK